MIPAQPTSDEARRLAELRQYEVLDTLPEQALDDLTSLAAEICGAPMAMISLIDESRQWIKSKVGLDMTETARDISFCGHAVHQRNLFIVPDALHDERFRDNPLVTGAPNIRFYAGAPLVSPADVAVGTLCVIDDVPRALTPAQEKALRVLARQVMMYLELRRQMRELAETEERLQVATDKVTLAQTASKRLSLIVEHSDDAIIGKDLNSIITSWNSGAEKIFGYPAAEMVGTSIMRLIPDDRRDDETLILAKIRRGQRVEHFETVRQTKDGRLIDVSVTASPIKDATGKVIGVSKVARDITERKRAEIAFKKSESLFRMLVEQAVDAFFLHDAAGRFFEVNRRACESLGYSKEELLNMSVSDISCMDEEAAGGIWANLQTGSSLTVNDFHRRKEGTRFPVEIRLGSLEVDGQKLYLGLARDITERKLAEERIAEQAALLDRAQDAIVALDLEGSVKFWNRGAERMYGWTRDEVLGRNVSGLFYKNHDKFEEANELTVSKGEWSGELVHLAKDRREITVESRRTLIRDDAGNPKSLLIINTDVTEKKKIEAQFMRAQRMESIGTLAGGVAHDLNNILAPILMSIDILKSDSDNPRIIEILETLETSAKRGADIVRQVLTFARGVEGERIEIQPKHLLRDMQRIIKDTFPKDIRLMFSIPNETWTFLGDPTQMHQILLNLCVNARDAMPKGGSLAITIENTVLDEQYASMNIQAKPGRYVNISLTDSGTGIPPGLIDKIFEPFFTTKELNKGTGLGLSTVMAIVKSHDGFINVYSEPGKGTTFKVYVPALDISSEGRNELVEAAKMPRGNGETVLVIDDEASILSITRQTLQAFGYRVLTAMDGADAVSVYVQHRNEIAAVLTDMMMPIMDGTATIHALIRLNPTVKIIAASGLNSNGGEARVAGDGVKHFLTKPYTASTLLKTLRAILDEA